MRHLSEINTHRSCNLDCFLFSRFDLWWFFCFCVFIVALWGFDGLNVLCWITILLLILNAIYYWNFLSDCLCYFVFFMYFIYVIFYFYFAVENNILNCQQDMFRYKTWTNIQLKFSNLETFCKNVSDCKYYRDEIFANFRRPTKNLIFSDIERPNHFLYYIMNWN